MSLAPGELVACHAYQMAKSEKNYVSEREHGAPFTIMDWL